MDNLYESENKVFSLDMLRELILDYCIRNNDEDNTISRQNVRSLRIVQKAFLKSTNALVQKRGFPLFSLELNFQNSVNGTRYVEQHGKRLDQFINSVTRNEDGSVPKFSLKIFADFFRRENWQSFSDCLVNCGRSLVELEMRVPANGGSLTGIFPLGISLPILKSLTVKITAINLVNIEDDEVAIPHSSNVTFLIQSILIGCKSLEKISLPFKSRTCFPPAGFEYISLPSTLKILEVSCNPTSVDLQFLLRNRLPNLLRLELLVAEIPHSSELIFNIFNNFRTTLTDLAIGGTLFAGAPKQATYFRFPVMEKLEIFSTLSTYLELESDVTSLETFLPKVHNVTLCHQSYDMIRKWTDNSRLELVTQARIILADDEQTNRGIFVLGIDLEIMQRIHLTFCNLRKLELVLSMEQTCGIKYMFMEMRQLTELKIKAIQTPGSNSDFWDALLIGTSVELIAGLRVSPEWEIVEMKDKTVPSIKLLTDLETLQLGAYTSAVTEEPIQPLISDLAFYYAFLKMPNLTSLCFQGRFSPSEKMIQVWRNLGKSIVWSSPSQQ